MWFSNPRFSFLVISSGVLLFFCLIVSSARSCHYEHERKLNTYGIMSDFVYVFKGFHERQGQWPTSISDVLQDKDWRSFLEYHARRTPSGKIGYDDWGMPLRFVPFNPSCGYGVIISDGYPGTLEFHYNEKEIIWRSSHI